MLLQTTLNEDDVRCRRGVRVGPHVNSVTDYNISAAHLLIGQVK